MNDKSISKLKEIQLKEKELITLIWGRDDLQKRVSELNDELSNIKESISFREDEGNKLYAELKELLIKDDGND